MRCVTASFCPRVRLSKGMCLFMFVSVSTIYLLIWGGPWGMYFIVGSVMDYWFNEIVIVGISLVTVLQLYISLCPLIRPGCL